MADDARVNLAASLHSTAVDLSDVAAGLADLSTDDEIRQQARILDRIAEEATDGAAILRGLLARRECVPSVSPSPEPTSRAVERRAKRGPPRADR